MPKQWFQDGSDKTPTPKFLLGSKITNHSHPKKLYGPPDEPHHLATTKHPECVLLQCMVVGLVCMTWHELLFIDLRSSHTACFTDIVDRWENPLLGADEVISKTVLLFYCSCVCVYAFHYFIYLSSEIKLGFWAIQKPTLHSCCTTQLLHIQSMADKH